MGLVGHMGLVDPIGLVGHMGQIGPVKISNMKTPHSLLGRVIYQLLPLFKQLGKFTIDQCNSHNKQTNKQNEVP